MQCMSPPNVDAARNSQLLKGVLDLCILALLRDGPLYGYAVVDALAGQGLDLVAEGTIYPLLTRMEKAGSVSSFKAPSPEGPPRKYYKITQAGEAELASGIKQWEHLNAQVASLLGLESSRSSRRRTTGVSDAAH